MVKLIKHYWIQRDCQFSSWFLWCHWTGRCTHALTREWNSFNPSLFLLLRYYNVWFESSKSTVSGQKYRQRREKQQTRYWTRDKNTWNKKKIQKYADIRTIFMNHYIPSSAPSSCDCWLSYLLVCLAINDRRTITALFCMRIYTRM